MKALANFENNRSVQTRFFELLCRNMYKISDKNERKNCMCLQLFLLGDIHVSLIGSKVDYWSIGGWEGGGRGGGGGR